jgi:hypothetical protein
VKRRLLKLCAFLLLSAIVNVGVAWGLALTIGFATSVNVGTAQLRGMRESPDGTWSIAVFERIGSVHITSYRARSGRAMRPYGPEPSTLIPHWLDYPLELLADQYSYSWSIEARGWPCASMWCRSWGFSTSMLGEVSGVQAQYGITVSDRGIRPAHGGSIPRVLPLRPIWPGFAINTVFYTTLLWLLFAAPFALRRRLRIRRNLCPHCAYPVGTSGVCTECGKAIKPNRTEVGA